MSASDSLGRQFVERTSPLDYHGLHPTRLAVSGEGGGKEAYFEEGQPERAFLDYSPTPQGVFVHYARTRKTERGQGHATALVGEMLRRHEGRDVDFGKVTSEEMESVYQKTKAAHPDRSFRRKVWF